MGIELRFTSRVGRDLGQEWAVDALGRHPCLGLQHRQRVLVVVEFCHMRAATLQAGLSPGVVYRRVCSALLRGEWRSCFFFQEEIVCRAPMQDREP